MTEDQAQTMIDLLIEISEKLTKLSDKVARDTDYKTVCDNLIDIESSIDNLK